MQRDWVELHNTALMRAPDWPPVVECAVIRLFGQHGWLEFRNTAVMRAPDWPPVAECAVMRLFGATVIPGLVLYKQRARWEFISQCLW